MLPPINRKEKFKSDMAKAKSLARPTLAKKNIVIASLNPKPPIEIGNIVIAPIMGKNTKK